MSARPQLTCLPGGNTAPARLRGSPNEAIVGFVRALARQAAREDHEREEAAWEKKALLHDREPSP